jgi:hypothetical protein
MPAILPHYTGLQFYVSSGACRKRFNQDQGIAGFERACLSRDFKLHGFFSLLLQAKGSIAIVARRDQAEQCIKMHIAILQDVPAFDTTDAQPVSPIGAG